MQSKFVTNISDLFKHQQLNLLLRLFVRFWHKYLNVYLA